MGNETEPQYNRQLKWQLTRLGARVEAALTQPRKDPTDEVLLTALLEKLAHVGIHYQPLDERQSQDIQTLQATIVELESTIEHYYPPSAVEAATIQSSQQKDETARNRELNRRLAMASFILGKTELASMPVSADIDPSIACNFRCRICHHSISQRNKRRFLPVSVVDKMSDVFTRISEVHLFGGGEPTLSPTLNYLIDKLHEAGVTADILTNGSTLGKRALPLSKLSSIGISFDAAEARTFEAIRVGSRFKRLVARIRSFKTRYPHVPLYFNTVLSRVNLDELPAIVRLAGLLGIRLVSIHRMIPLYPHHTEMALTMRDREEVLSTVAEAKQIAQQLGILFEGDLDPTTLPPEGAGLALDRKTEKETLLTMLEARPPQPNDDIVWSLEEALAAFQAALTAVLDSSTEAPTSESPRQKPWNVEDELSKLEQSLSKMKGQTVSLPSCAVPWFRSSVRADGTLRPCGIMNVRMGCIESLGSFEAVWNSKEYQRLRAEHTDKWAGESQYTSCKTCTFPERSLFIDQVREYARGFGIVVS